MSAAYNAVQAFSLALRSQPAAILLDITMPGGTGIEILKLLKNSSKTNQIPVIVVSGSIDEKTSATVKALGAEKYLPKPVDVDELCYAIHRVIGTPCELQMDTQKWR